MYCSNALSKLNPKFIPAEHILVKQHSFQIVKR